VDALSAPVSFARALLALARSAQSGVLYAQSELGSCRLAIARGKICAVRGLGASSDTLGDALLRSGELDARAHARALEHGAETSGPVGYWLIESGLASRGAIEVALRRQVRERVLRLLSCQHLEYRFERDPAPGAPPSIAEPMASADLVLIALRARVAGFAPEEARAAIPEGVLRCNALGRAILADAALWPEELAAAALLEHGATREQVVAATSVGATESIAQQCAARATRFLAVLSLLSALTLMKQDAHSYSLLLRKREQLRRDASPSALLDLPRDAAPADARRALRRLARSLHPDALGPEVAPALRAASSEIMRALIDAERSLRAPKQSVS
jgi:hypothetical protein